MKEEIRPQKLFDEYLCLEKLDAGTYFEEIERVPGTCPACETVGDPTFVKYGFSYETCSNCLSLFIIPRPVVVAIAKYYTESSSSKYWASTFYRETAEARREKLWNPKAFVSLELFEHPHASATFLSNSAA